MKRKGCDNMKKMLIVIGVLLSGTFIYLSKANAEVKPTNFADTIKEEIEIFGSDKRFDEYVNQLKKVDLSDYQESEEKINIYMFRGDTCSFCLKATTYFASIVNEYGKYFNFITYEVWKNKDNSALMSSVASAFNETASGVPYTVIGDKTFVGYNEAMNEEIEAQIKKVYESKDRFDIMKNLDTKVPKNNDTSNTKDNTIVLLSSQVVFAIIIVLFISFQNTKLKKEIIRKIESQQNEIHKK